MMWRESIERAERTVALARVTRAESLHLKVMARVARRRLRPVQSGSDDAAARIATVLLDRALCTGCVSGKTGVPAARVDDVLLRLGHTVHAHMTVAPCSECGKQTVVYRL